MVKNINGTNVSIKMTRGELARVVRYLSCIMFDENGNLRETVKNIHGKLKNQLREFDEKNS